MDFFNSLAPKAKENEAAEGGKAEKDESDGITSEAKPNPAADRGGILYTCEMNNLSASDECIR